MMDIITALYCIATTLLPSYFTIMVPNLVIHNRNDYQANTALAISVITLVIIASNVIPIILVIVTIILVIVLSSSRLQYTPINILNLPQR